MKAILLCAGYATRLYPLTLTKPKHLLQIAGKTMLDYVTEKLYKIEDIDEIFLVSNDKFFKNFERWAKDKKKVKVLNDGTKGENNKLGAIGDINFALENIKEDDEFLIVAGDNLFEFELDRFIDFGRKKGITIGIKKIPDINLMRKYSQVEMNSENKIIYFEEKPQNPKTHYAAICLYYFPKGTLRKYIKEYLSSNRNPDMSGLFIQYLHKVVDVYGFIFEENWYDIGDINQYNQANCDKLLKKFYEEFGEGEKPLIFVAPGRINIIGEHTDYNGGFVLPCAINKYIWLLIRKNYKDTVNFVSLQFKEKISISVKEIKEKKGNWADYPSGVIKILMDNGYKIEGVDLLFDSNIPIGGGLSSSGAIEVVTLSGLNRIFNLGIEKRKIPFICQKAENEFVGARCGIMDQFIITMGLKNNAILLNCKNYEYQYVPVNLDDWYFLISSTNVSHNLASGEYNKRRADCEKGLEILKKYLPLEVLSDLTVENFEKYKNHLPDTIQKRVKHVVEENKRVIELVEALKKKEIFKIGEIMNQSHISLRDLYEVSCNELEIMREESLKIKGVAGCRLTGAGFGGCTISLIHKDSVDEYLEKVGKNYEEKTGIEPEFHVCEIVDGCKEYEI